MLKTIFQSKNTGWQSLVLRLALGVAMFPHGAQKLLGWFGGYGFSGTMNFFTGTMHIPAPLAFLAIITEFFGALALIVGLFTRVAALGIAIEMFVAVATAHFANGFFMNWTGNQKGEGFEYHILAIAISIALLISGAGRLSADEAIANKLTRPAAK